jgi:hypothetical protein
VQSWRQASADLAQEAALAGYVGKNKEQQKEIEGGGGFQVDADLLPQSEAVRWVAQNQGS